KCISNITSAVSDISKRSYLPVNIKGVFADIYNSLNILNEEIHIRNQMGNLFVVTGRKNLQKTLMNKSYL
ncbi:hypothetical protein ACFEZT_08965, partial [Clostridioides difficile]